MLGHLQSKVNANNGGAGITFYFCVAIEPTINTRSIFKYVTLDISIVHKMAIAAIVQWPDKVVG